MKYYFIAHICANFMQDVMLCGGSDAAIIPIGISFFSRTVHLRLLYTTLGFFLPSTLNCCWEVGLGGFVACRALSQRNSDPTKASRPWDIVKLPTISLPLSILFLIASS